VYAASGSTTQGSPGILGASRRGRVLVGYTEPQSREELGYVQNYWSR
jgi:hypothetical protein